MSGKTGDRKGRNYVMNAGFTPVGAGVQPMAGPADSAPASVPAVGAGLVPARLGRSHVQETGDRKGRPYVMNAGSRRRGG